MLAHERLCDRRLLAALERRRIDLVVAVSPSTLASLPRVAAACRDAGVRVSAWPMLQDAQGRWASTSNAEPFARFAADVARTVCEIVFDLEPPFEVLRALSRGRFATLPSRRAFEEGVRRFATTCDELRGRGVDVHATALPLVLLDASPGAVRWQSILGTPVDRVAYESVSVMAYTTMIEGWSRGIVRRGDARSILHDVAQSAARRFGSRASISLGAVGTGAFGDEPVYRSPKELTDDVAVARSAGVDDLALFDLAGVVARPPIDAWLDAFVETPPADIAPRASRRVRLFRSLARIASRG
jgi:hypothetical protein